MDCTRRNESLNTSKGDSARDREDLSHRISVFWKGCTNLAQTSWPNIRYVKHVALGETHSAILTHKQVFCYGSNEFGQLGNGTYSSTIEPVEVKSLTGLELDHVAVGQRHTVCSTHDGAVYCWGDSSKGQCGTGDLAVYSVPTLVQAFNVVMRRVDCCRTATVCLTMGGTIFVWGSGSMLGRPLLDALCKPMQLTFLDARRVTDIACGADFCVAVSEKLSPVVHKFVQKNNYVVVHSASVEDVDETSLLARQQSNVCPLGLELAEEHVYLGNDNAAFGSGSARKVDKASQLKSMSRRSNSSDARGVRRTGAPSDGGADRVQPSSLLLALTRNPGNDVAAAVSTEGRSVANDGENLLHHHMASVTSSFGQIVADQEAAMAYLKKQLGEMTDESDSRDSIFNDVTGKDNARDAASSEANGCHHSPPLISRIVSSGTSSAAAVVSSISSMIQDSIVPSIAKLPLMDRLNFLSAQDSSLVTSSLGALFIDGSGAKDTTDTQSSLEGGAADGHTSDAAAFASASGCESPFAVRQLSKLSLSEQRSQAHVPDYSDLSRDLRVSLNTEVCTWGKGDFGQLGNGDTLDRPQPCFINCLNEEKVVSVSAGSRHVLALTADGRVFGWGDNLHDQLGIRKKQCILEPQLLEVVQTAVIKIAAGDRHSMFLHDHPLDAKPCLFYTGRDGGSAGTTVGVRISFVEKLGLMTDIFAGDSCNSCAVINDSPSGLDLCYEELKVSERDFYRRLLDVTDTIVKTILDSDVFSLLDKSLYAKTWRDMVAALYSLADAVGTNVQLLNCSLGSTIASSAQSLFHTHGYLAHFEKYSRCYHDFLALDGVPFLVTTANVVLKNLRDKLDALVESCRLERRDIVTAVGLLLQFPLRRVSEYRACLEKMSLVLENSEVLTSALSALQNLETCLSSDYNSAQLTQIFWEKCSDKLSSSLKEPGRRIMCDSKSVALQPYGATKLSNNWFILFNDVFVHVQGVNHRVYPLVTTWVEQLPEEDPVKLGIRLVMPEDVLLLQTVSAAERAEWLLRLHKAVYWCCQRKDHPAPVVPAKNGSATGDRRGKELRLTHRRIGSGPLALSPNVRQATHVFVKPGRTFGARYAGTWKSGRAAGEGEIIYSDGSKYRGRFRDGERCGYGVCVQKLAGGIQEILDGEWKDGKLDGFGCVRYANGDTYEGLFKDGAKHGHGVLKCGSPRAAGLWSVYVGEWRTDRRHGYGVLDDAAKGEKYLGQWQDDLRTGCGVLVNLDGSYCEGTFVNGKLLGSGLMLTSDGTCYEGLFAAGAEINGKGRLTLPNGDHIEGQFTGSWSTGLRMTGVYLKIHPNECDGTYVHNHCGGGGGGGSGGFSLPRTFGKYSVPPGRKWEELFRHTRNVLGCIDDKPVSAKKAWESVAVKVVSNRQRQALEKRVHNTEDLEKIPSHNRSTLTLSYYREIRDYLRKACESSCHPLGQLVGSLVDVYRATYLGAGAHPHLLYHARDEVKSLMNRLYDIIRLLFPDLPENGGPRLLLAAKDGGPQSPLLCSSSQLALTVEDVMIDINGQLDESEGEVMSWSLLLQPIVLPKIYPPLFSLFALQNEVDDEKYWHRVERFNKQSDVALLAYLGVSERFWFLNDHDVTGSDEKLSLALRDKCYSTPIEVLQQLTTAFTPAEKLLIVQQTFNEINKLVKQHLGDGFLWSMDDLFPVFQFVVIRARVRHLGAEIHFVTDLMDKHLEYGELGLMFTTLKACHFQIQTEKLV